MIGGWFKSDGLHPPAAFFPCNVKENAMKTRKYERPALEFVGSFESITLGGSQTGTLDSQFPVGTPSSVGVFS